MPAPGPGPLHANQSARDVSEHHRRRNPPQLVEDKIIGDVECPGEQTDPENRHERSDLPCHLQFRPNETKLTYPVP
jgi:hypothetical protein